MVWFFVWGFCCVLFLPDLGAVLHPDCLGATESKCLGASVALPGYCHSCCHFPACSACTAVKAAK